MRVGHPCNFDTFFLFLTIFSIAGVLREKMLPVIISLRNRDLKKDDTDFATTLSIPIVQFKVYHFIFKVI